MELRSRKSMVYKPALSSQQSQTPLTETELDGTHALSPNSHTTTSGDNDFIETLGSQSSPHRAEQIVPHGRRESSTVSQTPPQGTTKRTRNTRTDPATSDLISPNNVPTETHQELSGTQKRARRLGRSQHSKPNSTRSLTQLTNQRWSFPAQHRSSAAPAGPAQSPSHLSQITGRSLSSPANNSSAQSVANDLWVDKYAPKIKADLAVNKRKVTEVQTWLQAALQPRTTHNARWSHRLLVLTGPPGVGKTATLRVVANELEANIIEWINPTYTTSTQRDLAPPSRSTLLQQFTQFFQQADRFPSLVMSRVDTPDSSTSSTVGPSPPQVVLIEDMPNLDHRAMLDCFVGCIRSRLNDPSYRGYPIVLIFSDTAMRFDLLNDSAVAEGTSQRYGQNQNASFRRILPCDILDSPYTTHITFNPIAPTFLTKALTRVLQQEFPQTTPVDQTLQSRQQLMVKQVVTLGHGDIRSALNSLQLSVPAALANPTTTGLLTDSPNQSSDLTVDQSVTDPRESGLDLFHAMGKVLYNKKRAVTHPTHGIPEWIPETSAEMVLAALPIEYDTFVHFLHENYPTFTDDLDDVVNASVHLSDADLIGGPTGWQHQSTLSTYRALVSVRGLTSALVHTREGNRHRTFYQMRKPRQWAVARARGEFLGLANSLRMTTALPGVNPALPSLVALSEVFPFLQTILRYHTDRAMGENNHQCQRLWRLGADLNRLCLFDTAAVLSTGLRDTNDWEDTEESLRVTQSPNSLHQPALNFATDSEDQLMLADDPIED
ncbi:RFC checkpoint protein Rad17 [Dispira parvispora]|uniref:RFC checkpoint protein Rad17 n=1 Tax=Dispira parvispora TaxID=1520584 RepID=A0A9W8E843_9FUNG|nr:RFC checkpoint protein Rad17 [Dispira parvispora]